MIDCRFVEKMVVLAIVRTIGEWLRPGGRPGLQNQWLVALSKQRWVRLPSTLVDCVVGRRETLFMGEVRADN